MNARTSSTSATRVDRRRLLLTVGVAIAIATLVLSSIRSPLGAQTRETKPVKPVARSHRGAATASAGTVSGDSAQRISIDREIYAYDASGRRDPFVSLLANGELRPAINELRLVAVAFDPNGSGSVAILRDLVTREQYRIRVGQPLGRMRVARINPHAVVFSIEEFGFSRQETLALSDSTKVRTP